MPNFLLCCCLLFQPTNHSSDKYFAWFFLISSISGVQKRISTFSSTSSLPSNPPNSTRSSHPPNSSFFSLPLSRRKITDHWIFLSLPPKKFTIRSFPPRLRFSALKIGLNRSDRGRRGAAAAIVEQREIGLQNRGGVTWRSKDRGQWIIDRQFDDGGVRGDRGHGGDAEGNDILSGQVEER